jgi:hypothetical protein
MRGCARLITSARCSARDPVEADWKGPWHQRACHAGAKMAGSNRAMTGMVRASVSFTVRAGLSADLRAIPLALLLALTACNQVEPYARPGEWHPLGANAANLRAMVADPGDLYEGRGANSSPGDLAAAAVARLRAGMVKPLSASGTSDVRATDNGGQQQGDNNGPTAAAPVAAGAGSGGAQGGSP